MKILGLVSHHDCSFCVLEDGIPTIHAELERYTREKSPDGDSFTFFEDICSLKTDIDAVSCNLSFSEKMETDYPDGLKKLAHWAKEKDIDLHGVGHHQSHAANAFYSSNFDEALIVTIDGGGKDIDMRKHPDTEEDVHTMVATATTVWEGTGNKIERIAIIDSEIVNIGFCWNRITRLVFGLSGGYPFGDQAGTVMAMACMGDPDKYLEYFESFGFRQYAFHKDEPPYGPTLPATVAIEWNKLAERFKLELPEKDINESGFFDFDLMREIASRSEQDAFDVAAALQKATEFKIKEIFDLVIKASQQSPKKYKYLCLSGGVVLNSVVAGKLYDWYGHIFEDIYVCPVSYDAGLSIGSAQYIWHHVMDKPRIRWVDNATPYLGEIYTSQQIENALEEKKVLFRKTTDEEVLDLLEKQNIVSVFRGGSESGRRALGNRSIIADPRNAEMKDIINEKVKHRQWYRPFAPSILREEVKNWFVRDIDSPYMSFVIKFKEEVRDKVPAVVHFDGTARLQTVIENDNEWYYNFLSEWEDRTGVPILLNTSFNDREPIVETPEDAINCYMGTEIDYLYFVDERILVYK